MWQPWGGFPAAEGNFPHTLLSASEAGGRVSTGCSRFYRPLTVWLCLWCLIFAPPFPFVFFWNPVIKSIAAALSQFCPCCYFNSHRSFPAVLSPAHLSLCPVLFCGFSVWSVSAKNYFFIFPLFLFHWFSLIFFCIYLNLVIVFLSYPGLKVISLNFKHFYFLALMFKALGFILCLFQLPPHILNVFLFSFSSKDFFF